MHVTVTGASGFVGQVLVKALERKGMQVDCLTRAQLESMQFELAGDSLIHLAARVHVMQDSAEDPLSEYLSANLHATLNLARQAAASGIRRFVYVSTIKVNGELTLQKPFHAHDKPDPQDSYSISKWQAEQALRQLSSETGMEVVIVRPPLVYGPGVKANFLSLLNWLDKMLPMPLVINTNKRSMIYVENLADALIVCATHSDAAGKTYLVSDGEDVSTSELVKKLSEAMKRPCLCFPFPRRALHFLAKCAGKGDAVARLTQSLMVDSSSIRAELGWKPPYTLDAGLAITVQWYQQQLDR